MNTLWNFFICFEHTYPAMMCGKFNTSEEGNFCYTKKVSSLSCPFSCCLFSRVLKSSSLRRQFSPGFPTIRFVRGSAGKEGCPQVLVGVLMYLSKFHNVIFQLVFCVQLVAMLDLCVFVYLVFWLIYFCSSSVYSLRKSLIHTCINDFLKLWIIS